MRTVAFWLRRHVADTLAVLFIVVSLTFLLGPVVHAGLDRNQRCVSNAFTVSAAVLLYAQDYDGRLPRASAFNSASEFQTIVSPYTRDTTVFRCPAAGNLPYTLNQTVGGVVLETIPQVSDVELLRDPRAHPDGKSTVAYLDGHVRRGGVEQPYHSGPASATLCLARQTGIRTALNRYAQDHNQTYPTATDDNALRSALGPYTNNTRLFECPDSSQLYGLGTAFRGVSVDSIMDRSPIVIAGDPQPHRADGTRTTCYLDGYTERSGPNGIIFPNPVSTSISRQRRIITSGLNPYIQAHQGNLPVYSNYEEFQAQLMPYVRASRTFLPPSGGVPFQVNLALSGTRLSDHRNPGSVIVTRDLNDYGDGLITVTFLNGSFNRVRP
jgi:prepilin-type processing-associated H-X9-DG protein